MLIVGDESRWHWVESNLVTPTGPLFPPGAIRFFCVCCVISVDGQTQFYQEHSEPPYRYPDEPGPNVSEHSANAEPSLPHRGCPDSNVEQASGSGAAGIKQSSQFSPRASCSSKQPRLNQVGSGRAHASHEASPLCHQRDHLPHQHHCSHSPYLCSYL